MSTGMVKDFEETYQLAGQDRWAHTIKVPYRDGQGQVIGVLGIYEDITDRKQAETALRDSESHFRSLTETIPDALVVYDDLGRVTFVNKSFEELYGWSTEELVGKPITNFVPPSAENEITRTTGNGLSVVKRPYSRLSGGPKKARFWIFRISTAILRNMDGKHTASIVVHHDITARKRAQEKLHNSERTLSTILATSPVGIGLILDRKLKWVNDACLKMFGFENQRGDRR